MPTLEQVRAHGAVLDDLSAAATADLIELFRLMEGESPAVVRETLLEALPAAVDPYAVAAGSVSATFYEQVRRDFQAVEPYRPVESALPDRGRYESLIRWGMTPLFQEVATTTAVALLSGGIQRVVANQARQTIMENARRDPVIVGYRRVPSSGCCAFCGMLSLRTDYASDESASTVGGRGVEIPAVRRRGGQGRGIRARGSQRIGDDFHDNCHCVVSPVFGSDRQEMPGFVEDFEDAYGEAATKVRKQLNLEGSPGFGDSEEHRSLLLSEMRLITGAP